LEKLWEKTDSWDNFTKKKKNPLSKKGWWLGGGQADPVTMSETRSEGEYPKTRVKKGKNKGGRFRGGGGLISVQEVLNQGATETSTENLGGRTGFIQEC